MRQFDVVFTKLDYTRSCCMKKTLCEYGKSTQAFKLRQVVSEQANVILKMSYDLMSRSTIYWKDYDTANIKRRTPPEMYSSNNKT